MTNTSIGATPGTSTPQNASETDLQLSDTYQMASDVSNLPTTSGRLLNATFQGICGAIKLTNQGKFTPTTAALECIATTALIVYNAAAMAAAGA